MLSRWVFNCKEFHMPLKALFHMILAHIIYSAILTALNIFWCIMETCFYLNLLSRILTMPTSLLYFQTTCFLLHHELYFLFYFPVFHSVQFSFFTRMQNNTFGISIFFKDNKHLQHSFCSLTLSIFVDAFYLL